MPSMSAHKGVGCEPSRLHGRRTGVSCMDGMISGRAHAASLHATARTGSAGWLHQRQLSTSANQQQPRLCRHWNKRSRVARRAMPVSAMAAMPQLLPVTSTFGVWAVLNLAAATGLWSERTRHALHHACHGHAPLSACSCPQQQKMLTTDSPHFARVWHAGRLQETCRLTGWERN